MKGTLLNGLVLLALAAVFGGVAMDWKLPRREAPAPPAPTEEGAWCVEHDIAEAECFI